ncbi:hypothetical protein E1B28_008999 [Marasmius oreades]|uniref:Uncharacterized protein n=1 Tax=Marasmius oreades TaxID=181124 RepID=A0A9P7S034_9AGAR|nr:uncharacterized protein E1B28_008999 [Marasmius oreades]KAG7092663.1 hypothetical protein E1B28_008999 [Marasmius oreades]
MRLSISYFPLFLALCLVTDARRFIHRSELVPPPSCVSQGQIPAKSDSNIPPVSPTANSSEGTPPLPSGNSTVIQNSTIPLDANSTNATNGTPLFPRFSGLGFPSFLLGWQDLCLASGADIVGIDSPCFIGNTRSLDALLATADPCAQQDVADAMITFAKSKGIVNREDLIGFAVAYRKQPREAVRILGIVPATPYCLRAPINPELIGVINAQSEGVVIGVYGGPNYPIIKFGAPGSCPFGAQPDISSCTCVSGKVVSSGGSSESSDGTISTGGSGETNSTTTDSSAGTSNSPDAGSSTDGTLNSTTTDCNTCMDTGSTTDSSNSTETDPSTASNSTDTSSTTGCSNSTGTDSSTASNSTDIGSTCSNSTETNTSTGGSTGNSTETDSTGGTDSTETGTDSNGSMGTDSTDGADSTGTDSTDENSPPNVPPSGDNTGSAGTAQASQAASTPTGDGNFSGDVNDPNGR